MRVSEPKPVPRSSSAREELLIQALDRMLPPLSKGKQPLNGEPGIQAARAGELPEHLERVISSFLAGHRS